MKIIKAKKSDYKIVCKLMQQLDLPNIDCYWSRKSSIEWYIKEKNTYLLKVKNKYVGLITLRNAEQDLMISHLVIHKGYRHKGYGEFLINFSKQRMYKRKFKGISLLTMLQYRATKFYERMGFIKQSRGYYDEKAYNEYYYKRRM